MTCDMKEIIKCSNNECKSENVIITETEETWEYCINRRLCLDCNNKFITGWRKFINYKPNIKNVIRIDR